MSTVLRTMFMSVVFAGLVTLQVNIDTDLSAHQMLQDALEMAVHDASLAVDDFDLAQGRIVFDQQVAEVYFRSSLMYNLRLDDTLHPLENSFLKHKVDIILLEFYDHLTPDERHPGQMITFPFTYTNETYRIIDTLDGPGIIAVVEMTSPRFFRGETLTIRRAVVYEYLN